MLLTDRDREALANRIVNKARTFLSAKGIEKEDPETGLVHTECHVDRFVMIQHQRQKIKTGTIKTNGLDLWVIEGQSAKKGLSVSYTPFAIKHFNASGKAAWIERFLSLEPDAP